MTRKNTKAETKKSMAADGGERLPPPLWNLLKGLDDTTLAKIAHLRKAMKTDWRCIVLFLLKKAVMPKPAAKPRKIKG